METNADLVAAAIRDRMQSGRRLIVISASKSGPEVALALTDCNLLKLATSPPGSMSGRPSGLSASG